MSELKKYVPKSDATVIAVQINLDIEDLTYVKWDFSEGGEGGEAAPPTPEYVERIAGPGERIGFPGWYIEHIRSFI